MDQSIDKIVLVCDVTGADYARINTVIDQEKRNGFLCVSQSLTAVSNTIPVQYTVSLGFSKMESDGNMGG